MDMLVPLYNLEGASERINRVGEQSITIRLAMAYERDVILDWVRQSFDKDGSCWAGECEVALSRDAGYAYAVIGGVGAHVKGFYQKVVSAVEIADSEPGIYRDRIGRG